MKENKKSMASAFSLQACREGRKSEGLPSRKGNGCLHVALSSSSQECCLAPKPPCRLSADRLTGKMWSNFLSKASPQSQKENLKKSTLPLSRSLAGQ